MNIISSNETIVRIACAIFISIEIDRNDLNKLLTDQIALNSFRFTQQCISQKTNKSFNLLGQHQNSLSIMFGFCIAHYMQSIFEMQ